MEQKTVHYDLAISLHCPYIFHYSRMTIHLSSAVVQGYLSNEAPGLITGRIELAGALAPLALQLNGNFLRDIAGCRVEFSNPLPRVQASQQQLRTHVQIGEGGEMTASHRVIRTQRHCDFPDSPIVQAARTSLKNLLFFEWFNTEGQRLVIQSWHWNLRVSAPVWGQSKTEERVQIQQNRHLRRQYLLRKPRRRRSDVEAAFDTMQPSHDEAQRAAEPEDPFSSLWQQEELPQTQPESPFKQASPTPDKDFARAALQAAASSFAAQLSHTADFLSTLRPGGMSSALIDLIAAICDLAHQLQHTALRCCSHESSAAQDLQTEISQALPLLNAAVRNCESVVPHFPNVDKWWITARDLLRNVQWSAQDLLELLRSSR
jgi:hypothetical protein